jgi:PAS domain S-box-containing protein
MKRKMENSKRDTPRTARSEIPAFVSSALKHMVECSNDFIFIFDGNENCIYANPAALEAFGYSQADIDNIHYLQFVHKGDKARLKKEIALSSAAKESRSKYKFSVKTKAGDLLLVESIFRREYDKKGVLVSTQIDCINITDSGNALKTTSESEETHKHIFTSAPEAIIIASPEFNIIDCNNEALLLFGYEKKEMIRIEYLKLVEQGSEGQINAVLRK